MTRYKIGESDNRDWGKQ